jgi:hypothetical protein
LTCVKIAALIAAGVMAALRNEYTSTESNGQNGQKKGRKKLEVRELYTPFRKKKVNAEIVPGHGSSA